MDWRLPPRTVAEGGAPKQPNNSNGGQLRRREGDGDHCLGPEEQVQIAVLLGESVGEGIGRPARGGSLGGPNWAPPQPVGGQSWARARCMSCTSSMMHIQALAQGPAATGLPYQHPSMPVAMTFFKTKLDKSKRGSGACAAVCDTVVNVGKLGFFLALSKCDLSNGRISPLSPGEESKSYF